SHSATVGRTYGPPAQSLMPLSGSKTPQPEVASAPVPAVVGTEITSGPFLDATRAGAQLAPVRRWVYSMKVPPLPISSETALALSIELPPPTATIRSQSRSRYIATAASTEARVGSVTTPLNTSTRTLASFSDSSIV